MYKKVRTITSKIVRLTFAIVVLPIIIIVRFIRPFVLIRFGMFPSGRIGALSTCPELYLCERKAGLHDSSFDLFGYGKGTASNHQLTKMWSHFFRLSRLVNILNRANGLLPGGQKHFIPITNQSDFRGLLATTPRFIKFTKEEEKRGCEFLQSMGVLPEEKFICMANRDSMYLNSVYSKKDWTYHDYRDFNITDYVSAAQELIKRGFVIFRMGAVVDDSFKMDNPNMIDYATKYRNEFLDIYLLGNCHFFLAPHSGINSVSMIFRRPRAVINVIPLNTAHTWMPNDLFIPKKLWHCQKHRFLSFSETLDSSVGNFNRSVQYIQTDLEIINNTPEEILDLAVEMEERLKGKWQTTDEDEALQRRFWNIYKIGAAHGKVFSRIGTIFLRQNQELLADVGTL